MQQTDERDAVLIEVAASVVGRLMIAVEHVDHDEIAAQVGRLLGAITRHNHAMRERPSDAPLRRAVARLGANDR